MIFALDPGSTQTAYALMSETDYALHGMGKCDNGTVLDTMTRQLAKAPQTAVVIERIASYGMAVGREVFQTCEWVGRFAQRASDMGGRVEYIYRREEKLNLCGRPAANDANIRAALIERFAQHDLRYGKGTKAHPDVFYGVRADIWAAIAVGVTYIDKAKGAIV